MLTITNLGRLFVFCLNKSSPGGSDGKASAYNAGDPGSIPRSGRYPGEETEKTTWDCLENPMDGGPW